MEESGPSILDAKDLLEITAKVNITENSIDDVLEEAARLGSAEAHWHIALLLIKEEGSDPKPKQFECLLIKY